MIKVADSGSITKAYWLQNIYSLENDSGTRSAVFSTSFSNFSANGNLGSTPINGSGTLSEPYNASPGFYRYWSPPIENGTTLPLKVGFYARINVQRNLGFIVYTGYKTSVNSNIVWYGKFLVNDPTIQNASFYVTSKQGHQAVGGMMLN